MTDPKLTPPVELVQQWFDMAVANENKSSKSWILRLANYAAQWGADQELEACLRLVEEVVRQQCLGAIDVYDGSFGISRYICSVRRPKPQKPLSLKQQALKELAWIDEHLDMPLHNHCNAIHTIRRALEGAND